MAKRLEKEERARRRLEETLRRSGSNNTVPLFSTPKPMANSIEEEEGKESRKNKFLDVPNS